MVKMSLTEFRKWIISTKAEDIEKAEEIQITADGELIRKFVSKQWRNPAFPVH